MTHQLNIEQTHTLHFNGHFSRWSWISLVQTDKTKKILLLPASCRALFTVNFPYHYNPFTTFPVFPEPKPNYQDFSGLEMLSFQFNIVSSLQKKSQKVQMKNISYWYCKLQNCTLQNFMMQN